MEIKAQNIVIEPIEKLVEDPKNENVHSERQIKALAKIISINGFRAPLVVSKRSGFVIAGNGRLQAARLLGMTELPVIYQDFENEADELRHRLADNEISRHAVLDTDKMLGNLKELDIDLESFDFDEIGLLDFEFTKEPDEAKEEIEDDVPTDVETRCKQGDLWILGEHRLLCGDSTNIQHVERLMDGEKADMVFTDPPYGVAVKNTQGAILGDEDLQVFTDCLPVLREYSKPDAHVYVWCASGDMFPPSIAAFSAVFPFQNLLPVRCTHENKRGKKGAFKLNFETCLFANDNSRPFNPSSKFKVSETTLNDSRYKGDGKLRVYPALWDGERSTEHNMNIVHPTQKKVEMIEFYIEISCSQNNSVLDLFGGSGSTLIACEKTNRKCFMAELDPHYCDVILKRWEDYSGKQAKLEE